MTWDVVLEVIAVLIIVKSLALVIFPEPMKKWIWKMAKSPEKLRKTGWIYLLFGVVLLLISILLRNS